MAEGGTVTELPGKGFEQRVADAYRSLGFQVIPNVQLPGKQTDLIARKEISGAPRIELAIECKDHAKPISNEEVLAFVNRAIAHTQSSIVTGAVMVSSSGFTADARAAAADHRNITLLSWEELTSQIFDVRNQMHELVERYESLDIFHDYLPLGIESLGWTHLTPDASQIDLAALLEEWVNFDGASGVGAILTLADFGSGKTTLLKNIEYERSKSHLGGEDSRVPLFVPLREYRQSHDVATLLRASFREAYYRDIPTDLLWQRIEAGGLLVLLDGFDEMLDRSDARRRVELFHELMPVLRSRSPAILTSRPSYLVERGELETLLSTLREQEAAIEAPPSPGAPRTATYAERMRRKLVERHREVRPSTGLDDFHSVREVQAIRLLPLDEDGIAEFVERQREALETVGASVADLLAFIDRTYDLTDLASRPMLLKLIISSVLIGGLDLADTEAQYGASGLYEIYTHTKLDLDLAKGRVRQNGLSREIRRMLAEGLALLMYRENALELDFHQVLEKLRDEEGPLRDELESSGLSEEEIRTDFATCSFVTLERDGKCRFVHKSFRGFFIARYLKEHFPKPHQMLHINMEREVLYFLGGFAPTEPAVGEALWARFLRAEKEQAPLRRNLLVAFLYTRPEHDTRRIAEAEISEAEFGRLVFNGTRLNQVAWRDVTVMNIELADVKWKEVQLIDTHFAEVTTENGDLELDLQGTVFESWRSIGTDSRLTLHESTLHSWRVEGGIARVSGSAGHIGTLKAVEVDFVFSTEGTGISLADAELSNARLHTHGVGGLSSLRAEDSLITYGGAQERIGNWRLSRSVLGLVRKVDRQEVQSDLVFEADRETIIFAPHGTIAPILSSSAGVFGRLEVDSSRRVFAAPPHCWGMVEAEAILDLLGVPPEKDGVRIGGLLLVRNRYYLNPPHASLLLRELRANATGGLGEPVGTAALPRVWELRKELQAQHAELLEHGWEDYRDYAAKTHLGGS